MTAEPIAAVTACLDCGAADPRARGLCPPCYQDRYKAGTLDERLGGIPM